MQSTFVTEECVIKSILLNLQLYKVNLVKKDAELLFK